MSAAQLTALARPAEVLEAMEKDLARLKRSAFQRSSYASNIQRQLWYAEIARMEKGIAAFKASNNL